MGAGGSINDFCFSKLSLEAFPFPLFFETVPGSFPLLWKGRKLDVLPFQTAENALIQTDEARSHPTVLAIGQLGWPQLLHFSCKTHSGLGWADVTAKQNCNWVPSYSPSKSKDSTKFFQLNWKSWGWRPQWGSTECSVNLGAHVCPAQVALTVEVCPQKLYGPSSLMTLPLLQNTVWITQRKNQAALGRSWKEGGLFHTCGLRDYSPEVCYFRITH